MNVLNKRIVLTGASGGIGKALAKQLDAKGAQLVLLGRNKAVLDALALELNGRPLVLVGDLNNKADRQQILDTIESMNEPVDVLINNMGVNSFGLLSLESEEQIERNIQSNLTTPLLFTRSMLSVLNSDGSSIVNIGSTFGSIGYPGFTAYCSAKFGLRGFSEALSRELADTNIEVQHISPRATNTALNSDAVNHLNKTLGNSCDSPQFVAGRIVRAIEKGSASVTIGWPEKVFVALNSSFNSLVSKAIKTKLPTIKRYATEQ